MKFVILFLLCLIATTANADFFKWKILVIENSPGKGSEVFEKIIPNQKELIIPAHRSKFLCTVTKPYTQTVPDKNLFVEVRSVVCIHPDNTRSELSPQCLYKMNTGRKVTRDETYSVHEQNGNHLIISLSCE